MRTAWTGLLAGLMLILALAMALTRSDALRAEDAMSVPAPAYSAPAPSGMQTAIFAGGCFWGVQGVYAHVKGVTRVEAGYAGGSSATARYDLVSGGGTGHTEAVRIQFDPAVVRYGTLLQIFFSVVADPTTVNAQGPDHGTQYRSAIFPASPQQRSEAARYIAQLAKARIWPRPIVTRLEKGHFFPAESYHQDFMFRHPDHPYIRHWDEPKLIAFRRLFPSRYRASPVLTRSYS